MSTTTTPGHHPWAPGVSGPSVVWWGLGRLGGGGVCGRLRMITLWGRAVGAVGGSLGFAAHARSAQHDHASRDPPWVLRLGDGWGP